MCNVAYSHIGTTFDTRFSLYDWLLGDFLCECYLVEIP